jgi:hypothetical protein
LDQPYRLLVGIDGAKAEHTIGILSKQQKVIDRRAIEHSGDGLNRRGDLLTALSEGLPGHVAGAIETPRGAVVEYLVERGLAVYSLHPKQRDRFRDRHTGAGAKDDRRDAFVMADALRTDLPLFHRVRLEDPRIRRIRELSRAEQDLQHEQVRAGHQLRELLNRYYPEMLKLCPGVDEPWFGDAIELFPLPGSKLSQPKMERLLRSYRIRRLDADAVRQALGVPALKLAPGATEAASEQALLILPMLRLLLGQRKERERRLEALLDEMSTEGQLAEHRDVTILRSLPGVGRVITATMLAEASQALADRDDHALRRYGGTAPLTQQSGKRRSVVLRQGCHQRLRHAIYPWSRVSLQCDQRSREHDAELRAQAHSQGRALRGVADRLLGVLMAMLSSGPPYDPLRRVATVAV